eukprot:TRINITY_DN10436_c0_g1_i2.p1 TRINITY_DN10436_c0_g1~~TRINITY_DN10436_c0_g1_i2.p1  ORF type:complete len:893 (+),score=126.19 TRINITY_DN10436_c0_g1_i2:59-2737(+)
MSRLHQLLEALNGVLKGAPGADSWLLQEEASLVGELVEIYTNTSANGGQRQLCGVTLGRMLEEGKISSEGQELIRMRVGQMVLGNSTPEPPQAAPVDIITYTGCDIVGKLIQKSNGDGGCQELLTHCMKPQHGSKAQIVKRILSSAAPTLKGSPQLVEAYHRIVVCEILSTVNLDMMTIVRIALQQNPRKRSDLLTYLPGVISSILGNGAASPRVSEMSLISDIMTLVTIAPSCERLHNLTYELAAASLKSLTPKVVEKINTTNNDPSFGSFGASSVHAAIRSVLNTVCSMLSQTSIPTQIIPIYCKSCVEAATLQTDVIEDEEAIDLSIAVDIPGDLREASAWALSCLLKAPDCGGPCVDIPGLVGEISRMLSSMISGPHSEAAMYIFQQLFEGGFLTADEAPVSQMIQIVQMSSLPPMLRARACLSVSAVVCSRLPVEQHAFLINYQWDNLADASAPIEIRAMAALGCSTAVAHTVLNPGCLPLINIKPTTSLTPYLALVKLYPNMLLEGLNRVLQVLSQVVLTPTNVSTTLAALLEIIETNLDNTRLCQRALSVLCKGVIEEHTANPEICQNVSQASGTLMSHLLGSTVSPAVQALAASALDVASALCCCSCSCSSVAGTLIKPISEYPAEGKNVIRSSAKSLALSVSVAKGGDSNSFGSVVPSLWAKLSQRCDPQTSQFLAAALVSTSTFCNPQQLKELSTLCLQYISSRCLSAPDWSWPVSLCIPWCSLLASSACPIQECLNAVGSSPAEIQVFLSLWITVDAIFDPRLRHVSAGAACALLGGLPSEMLSQSISVLPIKTIYRKASPSLQFTITLCDALLVVLYRLVEIDEPLSPYTKTFLSTEFTCAVPGDSEAVRRESKRLLSSVDQSKLDQIRCLALRAACKQS